MNVHGIVEDADDLHRLCGDDVKDDVPTGQDAPASWKKVVPRPSDLGSPAQIQQPLLDGAEITAPLGSAPKLGSKSGNALNVFERRVRYD
jgi:hypothetical protein